MKKKRVSIRAVALAVAFILAFTPLGAYAGDGEPGHEPAPQAGEGEAPGSSGEYEETPGDDTPDNPGEGDSPEDSPGDGDEEPETPGDGNGEGLLEPENPRANTAMPLGSPIMPANYTNTLTSVDNLQVEINNIIGDPDKRGTITLDITGGTAELAATVTSVQITVDTEIRLRSDNPLTLTVDTGRHFLFDIASGATLTLYLDSITLEGGADKGGIQTSGTGTLSLQSGIVTNCWHSGNGGGVFAQNGKVEISGSAQISGNEANFGGGVYAQGNVEIGGNAQISGNKAADGGGVYAGNKVEISGSAKITGNEADYGGGVFAQTGKVEISGSAVIDRNTAGTNGGGVYAVGNVEIRGGEISDNTAGTNGGGVYARGNVEVSGSAQITGNEATQDGGGVWAWGNVEISGSAVIDRNTTDENGGGVWAWDNVEIRGGEISDNTAGINGGGVSGWGNVEIRGSAKITGNEAAQDGGGVFSEGKVEISGSAVIDRNTTDENGGGVFAFGDVEIGGSAKITGNEAAQDGGGVSAAFGNVEIKDNAVIDRNTAGENGGGVFAIGGNIYTFGGNVEIGGSAKITGNTAGENGGGVYADTGFVEIKDNAQITGNTAGAYGGGVYADDVASITVTGGNFKGNLAGNGGYWITDADQTSVPYNGWAGYTSASEPFTHIANNFDIVYAPLAGTPVHVAAFSMNDGLGNEFFRTVITSSGPLPDFPGNPSRDGFTFTGWNEKADGSGGRITKDYTFTTTKRVYAQWRANTPAPTPTPPPSGGADSGYIRDDSDRDNSDPNAGGVLADRVFRVALQLNGGRFKGDTQIRVKEGNTLDEINDPVREGYVFTGWYTDEDCTKAYSFHRAVHGSFTLYAGWEPLPEPEHELDLRQNPFRDVTENHWFYGDVAYVHENGLMSGISRDQFSPDAPVTRGMAAAILWRLSNSPAPARTPAFADLSQDWYRDAVAWANGAGIAAGYGDNLFAPEDAITREQLAVMLYNYAKYTGLDVNVHGDLSGYADGGDISGYALEAMAWANGSGYISGRSQRELAPKGITTRAEIAAIIHRLKEDLTEE